MTTKIRTLLLSLFVTTLAACGGGGSSDGGGSSNTAADGVYSGPSSLTLSAPDASTTGTGTATITISNGTVTYDTGGQKGSAALSEDGKNFSVPVRFNFTDSGVTCNMEIVHNGTINGNKITGTISGVSPCRGAATFNITSTGTFSTTKNGTAKAQSNAQSIENTLKSIIRSNINN